MDDYLTLGIILVFLGCLASVLSPIAAFLLRGADPGAERELSVFVAGACLLHLAGVSTASHPVNFTVLAVAMFCGLMQAWMMLGWGSALARLAGSWGIVSWIVLALAALVLRDGGERRIVHLGDGTYCQFTSYGMAGADSGEHIGRFRRFGFIDWKVASQAYSVIDLRPVAGVAGLEQCRALMGAAP